MQAARPPDWLRYYMGRPLFSQPYSANATRMKQASAAEPTRAEGKSAPKMPPRNLEPGLTRRQFTVSYCLELKDDTLQRRLWK
ncbi:hypothetical protein NDU88_003818 [Pleurodeles waltl]|uniref:Uncharacterized protein n=1 Tax=Pleurodeles waltl TaxID=8319 RepID=A0AAV7VFA5_PLEWA|nr:hypothetical protein NDU88_003818 [Pleurodeles waltl]